MYFFADRGGNCVLKKKIMRKRGRCRLAKGLSGMHGTGQDEMAHFPRGGGLSGMHGTGGLFGRGAVGGTMRSRGKAWLCGGNGIS